MHSINESTMHDSKIGFEDLHKLSKNKIIKYSLKNTFGNKYVHFTIVCVANYYKIEQKDILIY